MGKLGFLGLAALCLALSGCVSSGTKITEQDAGQFKPGFTTRAEVMARFGQPNATTVGSDGTRVDAYMHVRASANAASYIPVVGLLAGGATSTTNAATFTYDKADVLKSVSTTTGQQDVKTGLLNQ